MNVGDVVIFRGTVKEIYDNGSVLVQSDTQDGREYWFLGLHLSTEVPASVPAPAMAAVDAGVDPKFEEAMKIVKSKGYPQDVAVRIVSQLGPDQIIAG